MAKASYGLTSFKIGAVGSAPGDLTEVGSTVKGSFTIEGTEGSFNDFFIEENPSAPYERTINEYPSLQLSGECYDVDPETAVLLMDGVVDTTTPGVVKYTPPTTFTPKEVTAQAISAKGLVFNIPRLQINARPVFKFGTDELAKIVYTGKALLPAGGGAPWTYSVPD